MEQYPINTTMGGNKSQTLLAGYYKFGDRTILRNFNGATAIAMRVPEATKQGYVDIPMGGGS